jgi:AcrR family transcriptional regulator
MPAANRVGSATWWRARRAEESDGQGLSPQRITRAALDLIDAEGLDALSMRRLGEVLDAGAASIYRHVENKGALLMLVLDALLGGNELPPHEAVGPTWLEQSRLLAQAYRGSLLRHPRAVPLLIEGQLLGPNALAGREWGLSLFRKAGFSPALTATAYLALVHYVAGYVLQEVAQHFRSEAERTSLRELFLSLPADQYPTIVELAEDLAALDTDAEFEFGLDALLAGIAEQFEADTTPTPVGAKKRGA